MQNREPQALSADRHMVNTWSFAAMQPLSEVLRHTAVATATCNTGNVGMGGRQVFQPNKINRAGACLEGWGQGTIICNPCYSDMQITVCLKVLKILPSLAVFIFCSSLTTLAPSITDCMASFNDSCSSCPPLHPEKQHTFLCLWTLGLSCD